MQQTFVYPHHIMKRSHWLFLVFLLLIGVKAQGQIIINMAPIDGVSLTPASILGYQVHSSKLENVLIKGTVRYRNSQMSLSYTFRYSLLEGINTFSPDFVNPTWQFSSSALQEIFFSYNVLPSGTFEYCITITPDNTMAENDKPVYEECLYHRNNDVFLINLVDPIDKSKLTEFNPLLAWIANYSFSNELTYRIRVAEIKQGQNPINAIMRNQPVYDEKGLMSNSITYPVYAKPLVVNQPYAWTVDAYYKDILLGGAETWQFIIADTQTVSGTGNRSYVDVKKENGNVSLTALGTLKLKYILDEQRNDTLYLELLNDKNKKCSLSPNKLPATYGDNRYTLDLANTASLKHKNKYTLMVRTKTRHEYTLTFQYINPDFEH